MFGRNRRPERDAVEVTLGARSTFAGTLRSETSVRIDGAVAGGLIETPANVLITAGANVVCEIVAHVVSIAGSFEGAIRADRVELLAGSQVAGLITTASFFRDDGAILLAEVRMRENGAQAAGQARLQNGGRSPVQTTQQPAQQSVQGPVPQRGGARQSS